jgi:undecaprenyl-diphosphatase
MTTVRPHRGHRARDDADHARTRADHGVEHRPAQSDGGVRRHSELRESPLHRDQWQFLGWMWLLVAPVAVAVGLLIVHVLDDSAFARGDLRVSEWFADRRTPRLEDLAQVGAGIADTLTVIPVCAVLVVAFLIVWRRWLEPAMVVLPVIFEKAVFLPATVIAQRDRPPVGQLDGNPPSTSYFSGHTAAAVALYFGIFVVVAWHVRSRAWRTLTAVLAAAAVVIVGTSRLLLGMHYLSDVVVGIVVGAIGVLVVRHALLAARHARAEEATGQAQTARPRSTPYDGETARPIASSTP